LIQLIRDKIGPVAALRQVDVVAALPKSRSGKILRKTMRGIADGNDEPGASTIEDPAALDALRPLLQGGWPGADGGGQGLRRQPAWPAGVPQQRVAAAGLLGLRYRRPAQRGGEPGFRGEGAQRQPDWEAPQGGGLPRPGSGPPWSWLARVLGEPGRHHPAPQAADPLARRAA